MNQHAINEREWRRPENWHAGMLGVYSSEQDSRFLVPKRNRYMGWTLNFAHPAARFVLGISVVAMLAGLLLGIRRQ